MRNKVLKILSEDEVSKIQELQDMKNSIEDLAIVIAGNNDILIEHSDLCARLIRDNSKYKRMIDKFWKKYLDEYADLLNENEQLYIDYRTCELYISRFSETWQSRLLKIVIKKVNKKLEFCAFCCMGI